MLLALANPAVPGERIEQELVDALVERRELQPLLQIAERLVVRSVCYEALQQRGMRAAQAAPLRREPAGKRRAALDLQALEKVAGEQRGQRSQPLRRDRLDVLRRPGDLDRIDEAVREVEPDGVRLRLDPLPARLVDEAPDLAEAPAQLAARIVGNVPQQLAKLAARNGVRGKRQVSEERTHLA